MANQKCVIILPLLYVANSSIRLVLDVGSLVGVCHTELEHQVGIASNNLYGGRDVRWTFFQQYKL